MQSVVTIGDCIIDEIDTGEGPPRRYAGGAGLNLAAGLAKLGLPSALVTRVGQDPDGFYLLRYARDRAIRLVNSPTVDATGVARSTRVNGEPAYTFKPVMFRRRLWFTQQAQALMALAPVVAVNSFPFENPAQSSSLAETFGAISGIRIVDPNPRPRLIADIDAYREGFEQVLSTAFMVKMSDEDVNLLYGSSHQGVAERLFTRGVRAVLFTHGAGGATLVENGGLAVRVPIAARPGAIVDTMGAGDATLASVINVIVRDGIPATEPGWQTCLDRAMQIAAATCRQAGADLALP